MTNKYLAFTGLYMIVDGKRSWTYSIMEASTCFILKPTDHPHLPVLATSFCFVLTLNLSWARQDGSLVDVERGSRATTHKTDHNCD